MANKELPPRVKRCQGSRRPEGGIAAKSGDAVQGSSRNTGPGEGTFPVVVSLSLRDSDFVGSAHLFWRSGDGFSCRADVRGVDSLKPRFRLESLERVARLGEQSLRVVRPSSLRQPFPMLELDDREVEGKLE
jgi:hypothetical protein